MGLQPNFKPFRDSCNVVLRVKFKVELVQQIVYFRKKQQFTAHTGNHTRP